MPTRRVTLVLALLVVSTLLAACAGDGDGETGTPAPGADGSTYAAQVASTDLAAGRDERFQVGVVSSTQDAGFRPLSFGTVALSFDYLGDDGSGEPRPGPRATATYLPASGTEDRDGEPTLTDPATARGVYQAEDLRFDRPGVWRVTVDAEMAGGGPLSLETSFAVKPRSSLPAPGDRALRTRNLTVDSKADPVSIDSRAQDGAPVPDRALHRWTIAEAIAQGRPALVLFATPAYCQSRFCGPDVDALAALAEEYPDRAVYIHVEIWERFTQEEKIPNQAAVDWLYQDGDLTEPWLYLIGANGRILDRWGPLFDETEVASALADLPPMGG